MSEYIINPVVRSRKKRAFLISQTLFYLGVAFIYSIKLLNSPYSSSYIFLILFNLLIFGFYIFRIIRYFKDLDATKLVIDGDLIKLFGFIYKEKSLHVFDIREVRKVKNGLLLVHDDAIKSLLIPYEIEHFEEIEKFVEDKMEEYHSS